MEKQLCMALCYKEGPNVRIIKGQLSGPQPPADDTFVRIAVKRGETESPVIVSVRRELIVASVEVEVLYDKELSERDRSAFIHDELQRLVTRFLP